MDYSSPGSSVYVILQARILEWVAIPFSRGSSRPRDRTRVSHIAGRFFTGWATRETHPLQYFCLKTCLDRGAWWARDWGACWSEPDIAEHTAHLSTSPSIHWLMLELKKDCCFHRICCDYSLVGWEEEGQFYGKLWFSMFQQYVNKGNEIKLLLRLLLN